MTKSIELIIFFLFISVAAFAQNDTTKSNSSNAMFERIMQNMQEYKPDTTAVPDDEITKAIMELRNLKGGFNINEAVNFKIEEDRKKNEIPTAELDSIAYYFNYGNGNRWLNNAAIHIYRDHFNLDELNEMIRFYSTPAGQKLATDFPVIMLQTLTAAEMIKEEYVKGKEKED